LLFNKVKLHEKDIPTEKETITLKELIVWIRDNMVKERPELFIVNGSLRPGILALVNDADWELLGGMDCEVRDGDNVVFISTLHGG